MSVMSVFKQRRPKLMLLAVFISVMLVWRPWGGLELQARGLKFGVDIAGGSRITLELETSHVTIQAPDNLDTTWNAVRSVLEKNLNTTVTLVDRYPTENKIVVEVGKSVTGTFIQNMIGGLGTVVDVQENATTNTLNDAASALRGRADPYGMLGTRARTLGENSVLLEMAEFDPDREKDLLTKQGRLEIFIDNELVITDAGVERFDAPISTPDPRVARLPILFTDAGMEKFNNAARGKAEHPSVLYLDRPFDAILVFDNGILDELSELSYNRSKRMFYTTKRPSYLLPVSAIGTPKGNLSQEALEYLQNNAGQKLRVLLLGEFSAGVIENIPATYQIETFSRLSGETGDDWIKRSCGIISAPEISPGVATYGITKELAVPIVSAAGKAFQEARNLHSILSNKLPAEMYFASETEVGARLGAGFTREIQLAGVAAFAGVFLLVYYRYRRWKIGLAVIGITLCELAIALGAASAFGLTLGLPELAGLLVVISTGIDHQLIVTDEMLRGVLPQAKGVSVRWRASRALAMVYTAIFMLIVAMIPIAWLGFGAIRGFAVITIIGTILAFLLTRPAYVRIIDAILAG